MTVHRNWDIRLGMQAGLFDRQMLETGHQAELWNHHTTPTFSCRLLPSPQLAPLCVWCPFQVPGQSAREKVGKKRPIKKSLYCLVGRGAPVTIHMRRSEDNCLCQSSLSTLFETGPLLVFTTAYTKLAGPQASMDSPASYYC